MQILEAVMDVNERQPEKMVELLRRRMPGLAGRTVTVLGLAFKPGTDDMRESPAIPVVNALRAAGAHVRAFDPVARLEAEKVLGHDHITFVDDLKSAVSGTDAILLMTRWPEFDLLPSLLTALDADPVVVDGRRMLDPSSVANYEGIGFTPSASPVAQPVA